MMINMRERAVIEEEIDTLFSSKIEPGLENKVKQVRATNRIKIEVLLDAREATCDLLKAVENLSKSIEVMNQNIIQIRDIVGKKKSSIFEKILKK